MATNAPILIANSLTRRTRYKSTGAVNLGPFLLWTLLALAVAALLAAFMYWLFHVGYYYVIIVPFVCALAIAVLARREVLFEGDNERWRVPTGSITSCELEKYVHGQGAGATRIFYVVLRATRREGFWEVPIRERRGHGLLSAKRKKLASQLAAAIQEIRGVAAGGSR